ncbi:DUF1667 domain-containing protein [uncultured Eubacterium sp.]|uniref:DUF1667 domain-containing protein n=1 Tax=uncultured Eubacterium sp. TaxID=165185 RepID=UPI0015B19A8D|nr:DUF1667 domain-containing protein [uncultured Eubacterium sp.]
MTNLICIMCPKGCHLSVDEENGYFVTGNSCPRGAEYGHNELKNPKRVITSTVKLTSKIACRLPVKTDGEIPKGMMMQAMELLNGIQAKAPINVGDIVAEDVLGTGVNFVSAKTVKE